MPFVEFYRFPASDAFISDQSVARRLLDTLKDTKDQVECYYGLQVEDNKTGFLILVWGSYEQSANLKKGPSYLTFIEAFKTLHTEGPHSQTYVHFDGDTTPAFRASVTEYTLIGAKEGVVSTIEERKRSVDIITAKLKAVEGFHGIISGEIKGDSDTFAVVLGWDSVDVHMQAVEREEVKPLVADFMEITSPVPIHVKLTRHE